MVRQFLLLSGVALSLSAFADGNAAASLQNQKMSDFKSARLIDQTPVVAKMNDGSNSVQSPKKAASTAVQWKRPAGQFWGVGLDADNSQLGYYFTPLVLRPWTEYKFENISTATGSPSWECQYFNSTTGAWDSMTSSDNDVTMSYLRYETSTAPYLTYKGNTSAYANQYYKKDKTPNPILNVCPNNDAGILGFTMPVSSHYWGLFTRHECDNTGLLFYSGADVYPGMDEDKGLWFGTNNSGINAMATRFEKPDQPYLLNAVYFYYQFFSDVPKDIPMKAYVFKTVNDAVENEKGAECVELGELLAVSESFIPAAVVSDDNFEYAVKFEFLDTNPVTGAQNAYSLEIEDDITIVVTGFNADLGNGGYLSSFISADTYDEGYGNLGFLGRFEESEDGSISYSMPALKNFFSSPLHNTVGGVLADVSYPWIKNYYVEQPTEVKLANDGETTEEVQGLQYALMLMSTAETSDYEITYDGEEECEWLSITDVYDEYEANDEGVEEFTGVTGLEFTAEPNPNDETRVCHVTVSIPAASYQITFLQGSKAEGAVNVVVADGDAKYYDLAGRRVMNPAKGLYIKVNGNKAEKVIL